VPILTVQQGNGERRIPFSADCSLLDILDGTDLRVRSGCRGGGVCGLCRVRIDSGDAGAPTPNETAHLDTSELGQRIRLACQVMPKHDLRIVILSQAPKSNWRSLPGGAAISVRQFPVIVPEGLPVNVTVPCGVAIDLGTTHISISLYELGGGKWLAGRYGLNPQMQYGSDVMTRLMCASDSPGHADDMGKQVLDAIGEALSDIAAREGIDIQRVVRLVLVGNSAMLALLSGRNYGLLLQPRHWMSPIDCLPDTTDAWTDSLGIHPRANIEVLPPIAGFVGSDLLAGVLTSGLTQTGAGGLFIDFGTNSEIALWDGRELWVTSAAGGPAFEESGISCGAPAESGAIYRVGFRDGVLEYSVIGNGEPLGLCGSGLVDLIACLLRSGRLTCSGQFAPPFAGEGFTLARRYRDIVLTKGDVDLFQRAKAAIGTGIQVLLARAGMGFRDVSRTCVGGFFGRFLDVGNAREIGLLPEVPPDSVELLGNTALAGCSDALLSSAAAEHLRNLGQRARSVNLSNCHDFDDIFLENLYLRPMRESIEW
jgi:uncharacterized 2Fe-2S/4Fe-4S cluster protein (DUF4445 family)